MFDPTEAHESSANSSHLWRVTRKPFAVPHSQRWSGCRMGAATLLRLGFAVRPRASGTSGSLGAIPMVPPLTLTLGPNRCTRREEATTASSNLSAFAQWRQQRKLRVGMEGRPWRVVGSGSIGLTGSNGRAVWEWESCSSRRLWWQLGLWGGRRSRNSLAPTLRSCTARSSRREAAGSPSTAVSGRKGWRVLCLMAPLTVLRVCGGLQPVCGGRSDGAGGERLPRCAPTKVKSCAALSPGLVD